MNLAQRLANVRSAAERHGQGHVLAAWPRLSEAERAELLDDLEAVDFGLCAALADEYVRRRPRLDVPADIDAPAVHPAPRDVPAGSDLARRYAAARERGVQAIAAGRVAAFTVAGGQGTRLGYDGPKGGFPVTPVRDAPLFQVFAESLLGVERRYGRRPRWYIMTSPGNHAQTLRLFEQAGYYGLTPEDVRFFPQGQMPAFLPDGRVAMSAAGRVALSPDGHGGSLRALRQSGALDEMRSAGIEYISYFQVDNPLVQVIDPTFIGLHIAEGAELSSKAVTKVGDTERVGNFCTVGGRLQIIEYSDLPDELAHARTAAGARKFDAGSIAIHVISRGLVERLTAPGATVQLPWHRADKRVAVVNPADASAQPQPADVVKLEMFVFDAIPLAQRPLVMYTPREEEFSPVKNAEGADSPATARRDQVRRAARWLAEAGVATPLGPDGEPAAVLEISPRRALDAADLREGLRQKPVITPGGRLLLD